MTSRLNSIKKNTLLSGIVSSKFGPRLKNIFNNTTLLTHEFMEMLTGSEKEHLCSAFGTEKNAGRLTSKPLIYRVTGLKPKCVI